MCREQAGTDAFESLGKISGQRRSTCAQVGMVLESTGSGGVGAGMVLRCSGMPR